VDTGAVKNCLNASFARRLHIPITPPSDKTPPALSGVDGKSLTVIGTTQLAFSIAGYMCYAEFVVVEDMFHNVILGLGALRH